MKVIDNPRLGQDTADSLYERDFHAWSEQQAAMARAGQVETLDLIHLAEELDGMARSEQRALESRLEVLLMHLLKWRHQPERRGRSWRNTVRIQRVRLRKLLRDSLSLTPKLPEVFEGAYWTARLEASTETGLDEAAFPETCPFTLEQVLDDGYWPD